MFTLHRAARHEFDDAQLSPAVQRVPLRLKCVLVMQHAWQQAELQSLVCSELKMLSKP